MRIVALAYSCEPGLGSEPGVGWVFARMLSRFAETWVVTRANNRPSIESALENLAEKNRLHFVYVDLPPWARFYKRGGRGARLYYLTWQFAALRRVRQLQKEIDFDIAWHLTLANAWLGSVGGLLGPPFIYGPIGGGTGTEWKLLLELGPKGAVYEISRAAARAVGRYLNPLARIAWGRARLILVQNEHTYNWLPARHRMKTKVYNNAIMEDEISSTGEHAEGLPPTALYAGRLIPWKGVSLAIRAVTQRAEWRLLICGVGPDQRRLQRLANELQVEHRVSFLGLLQRDDLFKLMKEQADVFLFPSLHDDAGWVVAEAVTIGIPVVCLNLGGPPMLIGQSGVALPAVGAGTRLAERIAEELDVEKLTAIRDSHPDGRLRFTHRLEQLASLLREEGFLPDHAGK